MRNQKGRPPILGKFVKKDIPVAGRQLPDVVNFRLAITDEEPEGYNPYDKPPPPVTDAQLEASTGRRHREKPGR